MGAAEQAGISSALGKFITHDLLIPGAVSNESINSRDQKEELEPCMFGHALLIVIHYIVHLHC
jgi:hypothetical protein